MSRHLRLWPASAVMAALAMPVAADLFQFTGSAERADGTPLYDEQHRVEGFCESGIFQPLEHQVTYIRRAEAGEKAFANKMLDYTPSSIRPGVNFRQPDFKESLKITYPNSGSVAVAWQKPGGDIERSSVKVSDNLVVDAGFDNLVRENWEKVVSKNSVKFRFLAPTRGTDYAFILEPAQSEAIDADHVVQIRPVNLVLKFLVDPIILGYNSKGALTAYSGLTNVRENADRNYTAAIRYTVSRYPECELTR
ncbi:hypothetical protein [Marinobacter sp. 1_MG-2023]|uniref:hypothetical protein n=1 Tax=Marinobacter sp. 1_MG-2023 TaxID=3062627 RepID=UPI0026E308AD|nr:hypothetical protein [Marinobacter sp. 1_MG-2023]MDO6824456.1 hypothetical protein [Marinobacter sp. 1_MG-2023]